MRKFALLVSALVVSLSVAAQNALWSNNGLVSVKAAAFISVVGDASNQGNGIYDNSDSIFVTGNWTHNANNRCFDSIGLGWVYLYAADQHINGTSKTHFNNLVLKNQGVKYGDIDVYVDDTLFLTDREFSLDTNTVWVLNPDTGAVKRSSGYVSSLRDGGLLRRTNSILPYLFAVGSNVGTFRYRPVEFKPLANNQNHFKARFANVDATTEGFNRSIKSVHVCQINPAWYHRLYQISGVDFANVTIMYDTIADGSWIDIVHWQNVPEWESILSDTIIAGSPFNRISKFTWNNYHYQPFALANTSFLGLSGKVDNVTCNGFNNGTITLVIRGPRGPLGFQWSNSDTIPNINNLASGIYIVTVSEFVGCIYIDTFTVTQPTVLTTATGSVNENCFGQNIGSANLSVAGGTPPYNIFWSDSSTSPYITGLFAGTYWVVVSDSNGCIKNDSVIITQPPLLTANIVSANDSCFGSTNGNATVQITGGVQPYHVIWNTSSTATTITHIPAGTYSVVVTDSNGCNKTDSVVINQPARNPYVVAGVDTIIWRHDTIQLTGFEGSAYQWTPNYNLSCTDCYNPLAWPDSDIVYHLSVGDGKGCFYSDSVRIFVRDRPFVFFFIPNAITPNGDGYNDTWFIRDLEGYPDNEVRILNRWGDEVFSQAPYQNNWDGTWRGQKLPGGTYYYILKINYNGQEQKFDGPLTIIR